MPRKKRGGIQKVYNFYAKTQHDVVPCCLRRGKLPTKVLRALQKAVKPTMDSWQLPSSVALNDFGVPDKFLANGIVARDCGGDLCWLRNTEVPKGKVSAGPYRKLGPAEVRSVVDELLENNPDMLEKVEKLMDATHSSAKGPQPAFAASQAKDAIFPYMCLQRRWPHQTAPPLPEHPDDDATAGGSNDDGSGSDGVENAKSSKAMKAGHVEAGIPWHVDGGPSICFMALTLEGTRTVEIETVDIETGATKTKRFTFRPGDWYWSSPSCFWHRVSSICKGKSGGAVSTTLLLRSAILMRRISGGRITATGRKTNGMKYATKECFCKLAPAFADIIKNTKLLW